MIPRSCLSSLLLALAAAAAGSKPQVGHASEMAVAVPLVLLEPPTVSSRAFGIGWGGGLGVSRTMDAAGAAGPDLQSATAAQLRADLNLAQTLTLGLQLTDYMAAAKLKVVANQGLPVIGKWSFGVAARAGSGGYEDGDSTSRYCPGWLVIFPTVASEWEDAVDTTLSDFALVVGRRLSRRGMFFGGPFVGSVGYRLRHTESRHECGGGSSSQQSVAEGDVSYGGLNFGYAAQFERGQLLIEAGVVRVTDGPADDVMLRLNVGGDYFFGRSTGKGGRS